MRCRHPGSGSLSVNWSRWVTQGRSRTVVLMCFCDEKSWCCGGDVVPDVFSARRATSGIGGINNSCIRSTTSSTDRTAMYRPHDSEPPADAPPHVRREGTKNHLVSAASHRHKSETCKNTSYLINRHCHQRRSPAWCSSAQAGPPSRRSGPGLAGPPASQSRSVLVVRAGGLVGRRRVCGPPGPVARWWPGPGRSGR